MTLGERLQQLRKEKQMSQEELGNLLLVSRQTVSLWENNQTVPTVDNLIRLKETFGVSIDSILTGEEPTVKEAAPKAEEAPPTEYQQATLESYCYSVNRKDLFFLSKLYCTKPLMSTVIFFVLFIGAVAGSSEVMNFEPIAPVCFFAFFISIVSFIRCFIYLQKVKRDMCQREHICELYQNYIILKSYKDGSLVSTRRVLPQEIKTLWNMPYCCFIHTKDNLLFPIKKSVFKEFSYMGNFCNNLTTPKTDFRTKKIALLKASASSLFAGTFVSFYLAIAYSVSKAFESAELLSAGSESILESMESFRSFHFFLPIPILSIIVGIILNKNKIRNRKNIIAGVIIGFLMLIYGFFPSFFSEMDNSLDAVELKLGFDLPAYTSYHISTSTDLSGEKLRVSTLEFPESASNEFEATILEDERWSKSGKEDFSAVYPPTKINIPYEVFLIYNVTTNEFGKLPDSSGEYEFIYIAYDTEMNTAYIFEYTAEYKK